MRGMSKDNSPPQSSDSRPLDKPGESSAPLASAEAALVAQQDSARRQSSIAQPVDALRQSAGQDSSHGANASTDGVPENGQAEMAAEKTAGQTDSGANQHAKPLGDGVGDQGSVSSQASKPNFTLGSKSTMNSPKQTPPNKASVWRGVWGGVVLGLVLIAAALGAGLWWQQQRFETVAREVATRLQQSDQLVTQARQNADQALSLANAQREALSQLTQELSVTANELKTLQQAWQAANEGLDQTLLLNDLRRLINMSNQELVLFGNVTSAVSILTSVQSMLQAQTVPALRNLLQAVTTDLARLRALPQVDVAILSSNLDSLIVLTGKAPLLVPEASRLIAASGMGGAGNPASGDAANGLANSAVDGPGSTVGRTGEAASGASGAAVVPWWQQASGAVQRWSSEAATVMAREFSNLLSIRKADDPQALLLSEEQAIQLRANVRAMLLSAQLALMTRQADIWRSELSEVQSLLNTRYDTQALDTKASLKLLDELMQAPVAAQVPNISATLSALAAATRTLSIPKETVTPGSDPTGGDRVAADAGTSPTTTDSATSGKMSGIPGDGGSAGAGSVEPTVSDGNSSDKKDAVAPTSSAVGQGG